MCSQAKMKLSFRTSQRLSEGGARLALEEEQLEEVAVSQLTVTKKKRCQIVRAHTSKIKIVLMHHGFVYFSILF